MLHLGSFFKFLSKNKLYTAINIFGFAISLMFVIIIADYTVRQLTTDDFQEKGDRIYTLGNEEFIGSAYKISDDLVARYPDIETICNYLMGDPSIDIDGKKMTVPTAFVDSCFFDVFSFKLIDGDRHSALVSKGNVVVTESYANRVWGTTQGIIGKPVLFASEGVDNKGITRVVSAVMKDIENSIFPSKIELLVNMGVVADSYNGSINKEDYGNAGSAIPFILTKENSDLTSKTEDMAAFFKEFFWIYEGGAMKEVTLTPLKDMLFTELDVYADLNQGNKSFVIILLSVGILILFFAVINYINLTVAQTTLRAKEMATRRLLGATGKEIVWRFIGESVLLCAIAFLIALVLSAIAEPFAASLLQSPVSVLKGISAGRVIAYIALVLAVGSISGVIPATVVSRYKPIDVVKGSFKLRSKMVFSKGFLVFQNIITIALIATSITMSLQIKHMLNAPLGYNYKNIIDISAWQGFHSFEQISSFKKEALQLACVKNVGLSAGTPLSGGNNNTVSYGPDKMVSFQVLYGDSVFFNMMGFELIQDNHLAGKGMCLNEEALRQMDLSLDAPEFKLGKNHNSIHSIAGVYRDFQIRSKIGEKYAVMLKNLNDYDALFQNPGDDAFNYGPWNILVEVTGDHKEAFDQVAALHDKISGGDIYDGAYIETKIEESMAKEKNLLSIVSIFTLIAVLISALGLLAMSTFFIQQRRMEIAVRKVFGSSDSQILGKLVFTFMKSVLVAFVLAIPVIWVAMHWWLESYIYKISISPLIFIAAGLFAVVVAALTVIWQSLSASRANPAQAVRS